MRLIILTVSVLLSFVSCKQNIDRNSTVIKSELQKKNLVVAKSEQKEDKINECNVNDSLRIRFEYFNNKETVENAYEIMRFIQQNEDDIIQAKCSLLPIKEWFVNSARISFIRKIESLNKTENSFNGVEYLYNIRTLYSSDCEMDEFLGGIIAKMAYNNPHKFMEAVENFNGREEFLFYPSWEIR